MSRTPQQWDALLALTLRSDGTVVLTSDGSTAHAREINLSTAFTATYDGDRRRFEVGLNTASGFTLTNDTHGALGYSIDGTDTEALYLHQVASPDPEGHPGFLPTAWANNLQWYKGTGALDAVGTFGIAAANAGYSGGLVWLESVGVARYAARRDYLGSLGELADGTVIAEAAGGTVTLPATHPYQIGETLTATIDNSGGAAPVTITCPVGHYIGGVLETDYVVGAGAMVTIKSAGGPGQDRWAVLVWTV